MNSTVTDSEMNEFTHKVADALEKMLGETLDRNELNSCLETLLRTEYGVRVVADPESKP